MSKENDLINILQDDNKKDQVYESIFNYFKKFCHFMNEIDLPIFKELYSGLSKRCVCESDQIVSRGSESTMF